MSSAAAGLMTTLVLLLINVVGPLLNISSSRLFPCVPASLIPAVALAPKSLLHCCARA